MKTNTFYAFCTSAFLLFGCASVDDVSEPTSFVDSQELTDNASPEASDIAGCQLLGCDDGDPCSEDTCTPQGCTHVSDLDDDNVCTYDDPVDCFHYAYPAGTSCGGNRTCNGGGDCTAPCVFSTDCPAVTGCETRACVDGVCHQEDKDPYTPCGAAGSGGLCMGGECSQADEGPVSEKATAPDEALTWCLLHGCDDDNACTLDKCRPGIGCVNVADESCTPCSSATECSDGNDCTADLCGGGACRWSDLENGAACAEDGQDGICVNGGCCTWCPVAERSVDEKPSGPAGDTRTSLTCLVLPPESDCTKDGVPGKCTQSGECCTGCIGNGGYCSSGASVNGCGGGGRACDYCHDGNACTSDVCQAGIGCVYLGIPAGSACSYDGGAGACLDGSCCHGFVTANYACYSCDDGNPCTWDHGEDGCEHADTPSGEPCPGGVCDGNGGCAAPSGACEEASDCSVQGPCWYSVCTDGGCAAVTAQDGGACPGGTCIDGTCTP